MSKSGHRISLRYIAMAANNLGDTDDIVELPAIPSSAPDWVQQLPSNGRYVDRTKLYDITGHLLFDSLLNANGIQHFYYFMSSDKEAKLVEDGFKDEIKSADSCNGMDGPEVRVAFQLGHGICGHKGLVHGGLTATMIDEVSGAAAFACVGPSFTANLNIDYLKPIATPNWVLVRAHVNRQEGRKAFVECVVENGEGIQYAKGRGLFIKPKVNVEEHLKTHSVDNN
ncbi:unnamed protein product [Didymodactylos carnosus]|uniref:Thioesterase domain-containing protein n=1 Tax=Didymodactylos carnosus TaxID=1234261 RepID=A0A8S2SYZ8_9BILA|nr:unnamed protein product [Didymodactylos carnosus]CAF4255367.1 unnamed protein product [Didymodactylos carnosus]